MGCSASRDTSQPCRVLMLGLNESGSTTLLYQLWVGKAVLHTVMFTGFNIANILYKSTSFTLWDIGGGQKVRPKWKDFLAGTGVLLFIVDSSKRERFPEALETLQDLLRQPSLKGVPLIVLANKQDVEGAAKCDEVMLALELIYIQGREWCILETSGKTGEGKDEILDKLVELCPIKQPQ